MAIHAGVKHLFADDYGELSNERDSVLFKFPTGIKEVTKKEPGKQDETHTIITWMPLKFDTSPEESNAMMSPVNRWCTLMNLFLRRSVETIYRGFDEPTVRKQSFALKFRNKFQDNQIFRLSWTELYKIVLLLGGPGDQGFASCASPRREFDFPLPDETRYNQNGANLEQFKQDYMSKPTTWLCGHEPARASRFGYLAASGHRKELHFLRTDTQFKRPSFAVGGVVDKQTWDAMGMATETQPASSEANNQINFGSDTDNVSMNAWWTENDGKRMGNTTIWVGPMLGIEGALTHRMLTLMADFDEQVVLVPLKHFKADGVFQKRSTDLTHVTFSVGVVALPSDNPITFNANETHVIALKDPTNKYLSEFYGDVKEYIENTLEIKRSDIFNRDKYFSTTSLNNGDKHMHMCSYMCDSTDPWLGVELDADHFQQGTITPKTTTAPVNLS